MSKAVKAVGAIAVGVAVGFVAGPWAGVAVAGSLLSRQLAKPPSVGAASQAELKQVIRSSKEPARYVFGRAGTGALLAWAQEQPGEQQENERLHLVYVLTEGTIAGLDEIYVNQEPVATAGDRIEYELVNGAVTSNAYLLANSPDWQESQIGRDLAWVRVSLRYDPDYFASGIPDLLFEYRGRNDIYDPRTLTSGYTNNAALVILWYIRHRLRVPDDEILWDTFIDAANVCDEIVTNPDGSTERRYTVSGGFKADERKDRVLADLEAACAGSLIRVGGKFGLQVGAYYGPFELTIDEDMVIGTVTGQTEVSRADAVNTMRGKFVSPEQRWTETDYPAVSVAEWVAEDGEEIEDTLDLRFVSSPYQAQRLANIALRRKRAGGTLELPLNFRGYACRPGRVVQVALPTLNISGEFRVVDWDFSGENGCRVTLQQEQPEIYDDAVGQPFNPFGFIQLPTGGIGSPTGLQYVLQNVGEVIQGRLIWNPVDAALHYNVVIKREGVAVKAAQVPAGVERCDVGGLEAGSYTAEVRARGRLGQSGPAVINFTVNVPATPDRVITTVGNREITLVPVMPPGEFLGGGHYRFYVTQSEAATQPQADYLGDGLTFTHTGLSAATTYYYFVQSVNAYGASPFLRVGVVTTNNFDEEFAYLENEIYKPGGIADQFQSDLDGLADTVGDLTITVDSTRADATEALQSARDAIANGELTALEQQIQASVLQAQNALGNAVLDVEHSVRVSEEFALAQQITQLEVTFNGKTASLTEDLAVLANDQQAIANSVTALTSTVGDNTASIENVSQTIALDTLAQAIKNAMLQVQNALGNAVVDVENVVRVDAESALAQQITQVGVEFDQESASVRQELAAVYDPETGAVAQAVTTVNVNGVRGVVGIQVAGGQAQIIGIANKFAILNPVNNQLVTAFVVSDGRVIIPEAFIDQLTITKLRAADGSLAFQNGKLRVDLFEVTTLVSSTQVNGRPAFAFNSNGTFELNSAASGNRVEQDGSGLRVYDSNGSLRVRLGMW
ncbi:phage tail tip protein J-related protein [Vreelandella sp.]|uniref:phage tail tip protein J-related protein n=1 Tax=Vreelandella sp. TaxID=3137778 RepID=UPI003BABF67F